jgi:fructokinase
MRLGIDLGGTKTEAAIIGDDGDIVWRQRTPTPSHSYDEIVETISALVTETETETGFAGPVGMGIPGCVAPKTGLVRGANTTTLNNKDLKGDVEAATGRSFRLANDANCFTLSEASDGAAAGYKSVFGVIAGTGCGGGFVAHGKIIEGANGITGEWGHAPLPWALDAEYEGHDCWCGNRGCIETFISGPAVSREYEQRTGTFLTVKELAERTSTDLEAESVLQALEDRLARGLAQIINIFDPDAIVLGGGISNLDRLYTSVPPKWPPLVFSDTVDTPLLKPKYGDSSGVRGAAWLWPHGDKQE